MVIQEFVKAVYSDHQLVIPWSGDQRLPIYDLISEEARLEDISGSTSITGTVVVIVLPDDQASNAPNMANIEDWANQGLAKISYVNNVITLDNSWTALQQSAQENGFQIHLGLQSDILSDGEVIPLMVNEQNNLDVDPTLGDPLEDLLIVPSNIDVSLPVVNGSIPQYDIDSDSWSLLDIGTETSVTGTFQVVVGAEDPDNNPVARIFLEDVAERILINMQSDGQGGITPTDLQTLIADAESNGMFVAFAMTYNMSGTEILVPLQLTDTGLDFELPPIDDDYISPQQVTGLTTVRSEFFPLENTVADAPNNDSSANNALNSFLASAELDGFTHHLYTFETPNAGNFAGLGSSYVAASSQSTDAQAGSMASGTASGTLHYDGNLSVHLFETGDSNANSADAYGDDPGIATHPGNDADRGYNQTTNGNQYLEILPGNNTVGGVRLQFHEDVYGFSLYVMGREDEVSDGNGALVAKRDVFLDVSLRDSSGNISVTRELTDSGPQGGQQFFAYMLDPQADLVIESVTLVEPLTADNGTIGAQNDLARDIFAIDDLRIVTKVDVSGPGPEGDGNTNGEPVPYEIRDTKITVQVGVPNGEIPLYNLVTDKDSLQTFEANSISGTLLVAVGLEQGQTNPDPDIETLFTEVLDDIQPLISDADNDRVPEFNEALGNIIIAAENKGLFVEFGLSNIELGSDIVVPLDIDTSGKLILDNYVNFENSPISLRNINIVDDVLTVDVWIDPNGQSLESFDFYDVTFDAGTATLDKVEALVSGWTITDSQTTAGNVNIGGYSLDPITSETGFLKLTFTLTDKTKDLVLNFDDVDTELTVNDGVLIEGIANQTLYQADTNVEDTSWLILEPQKATADELILDVRIDGAKLAELAPDLDAVSALAFALDYDSLDEFEALAGSDDIASFSTKGTVTFNGSNVPNQTLNDALGDVFQAFQAPIDTSTLGASDTFGFVNFVKTPAVNLADLLASTDAFGVSSNDGKIGELVLNPKANGPVDIKITNIYIAEDPTPILSDPDGVTYSFEVGGHNVLVNYWSETSNAEMPAISNQEFVFSSANSTVTATTDATGTLDAQALLSSTYTAVGTNTSAESAISISDVIATLKAAVGISELSTYQKLAADVTQDDQVTISDVISVLKIAVGIEEGGTLILTDQGNDEFTITSNTTELTAVALGDVDGSWANSAVADIL